MGTTELERDLAEKAKEVKDSPTGKNGRPSSKELLALARRFKHTGGGHWRVVGRDGRRVEYRGKAITVSGNPSPGVLRALEEQLEETKVLQGTEQRAPSAAGLRRRKEALDKMRREQAQQRQEEANALRSRYVPIFAKMGGLEVPGLAYDLGHVAAYLLRGTPRAGMTPDLLAGSATRAIVHGAWTEAKYRDIWMLVAERLEGSSDPVGEWYNLLRDAKGLPATSVRFRLPSDAKDEWPFRVELLPIDALLADPIYQRPPSWGFVRKEAARYDPTLVGTIDVAQRGPSRFAILDGQQRTEIVRLVGKRTIWASIYVGLDLQSEARFFLHKNANRKNVHPFYTFRAMVASGEPDAIATEKIVEKHGYKLAIGAPTRDRNERNIVAITAVLRAFGRKLPDGSDTLDPVLAVLSKSTLGREDGQTALMIRGLSRVFLDRPDTDLERLTETVSTLGPALILGRASDLRRPGIMNGEQAVARVISSEYDKRKRKAA
jgi:hypothetical protein